MPTVVGSPFDRANDGIFCAPIGRASIGYYCFLGDVVDEFVSGATNRGSTSSLPYSGDKFKKEMKQKVEDMDLSDWEKQLLIEDEEVLWLLKMFMKCQ